MSHLLAPVSLHTQGLKGRSTLMWSDLKFPLHAQGLKEAASQVAQNVNVPPACAGLEGSRQRSPRLARRFPCMRRA